MEARARIGRWLTGRYGVLVSGVVFAVSFWLVNVAGVPGLMRSDALGRVGILDMDYGYEPERAQEKLEAYGAEGRAAYRQFLTRVDFVYPAVVGWFLCVATVAAARSAFPGRPKLAGLGIVPLLSTAADWAENATILGLLARHPDLVPWLARLASGFTLAKGIAGIASLAVLLSFMVVAVVRRSKGRVATSAGG